MKTRVYLDEVHRNVTAILAKAATITDAELDDAVTEQEAWCLRNETSGMLDYLEN